MPIPLTWSAETPANDAAVRRERPSEPADLAGYAIAFGAVLGALAITRLTWPLFAHTPLILLFGATFAGRRTGALMVFEDVTRRRNAESELRAWEARYRALFEQLPIGLFQSGADGRLAAVNPSLLALLGIDAPAAGSARIADFIIDRVARSIVQDAMAAGRAVTNLSAALLRRDGGRVEVVLDVRPARGADGAVIYYDGVVRAREE
jgi:PAS domain S-box-containing protein